MNINNKPQWHDIDVVGERTGARYTARVCIKPFLPHREARDAQMLAEEYCGSIRNIDVIDFLTVLAFIKFHVVKVTDAPWYDESDPLDTLDKSPYYAIANKIQEIQNPKKDEADDKDSKASSGEGSKKD